MLSDHSKTLKVRLVCTDSDDYIPEFYRSIPLRSTEPICTQLEKEIPFWTPANPVLLDLPPGTGKTSFVYETLIPTALAQGKICCWSPIGLLCQPSRNGPLWKSSVPPSPGS